MTLSSSKLAALLLSGLTFLLASEARGQCTPPLFQGYPSSCTNIHLRFLNRDPVALISHYEILRGGQVIGTAPAAAVSYTDAGVGCSFGATYTIRQVMKSGATCQVATTSNPPHTKPCDLCGPAQTDIPPTSPITVVRAADSGSFLAPNSIATVYGTSFTSGHQSASSLPLPTTLAGVGVRVNGVRCGLFFANNQQINFLLPASIPPGPALVEVLGTDGAERSFTLNLFPNWPAVFTENQQGSGLAAANYLRLENDPSNYVTLWATGINTFNRLDTRLRCGSAREYAPIYIGQHADLAGLVQINFRLPGEWSGAYVSSCRLYVNGTQSNSFDLRP